MYSQLKIVLGVSLLLIFSCEETPPKAGYSFQIEATSLTIEPILSQKITQSTATYDWAMWFMKMKMVIMAQIVLRQANTHLLLVQNICEHIMIRLRLTQR